MTKANSTAPSAADPPPDEKHGLKPPLTHPTVGSVDSTTVGDADHDPTRVSVWLPPTHWL